MSKIDNLFLFRNGTVFNGRNLRITLSNDTTIDSSRSLFVGNLPWKVSEQSLFDFFNDAIGGKVVESVRIVHDKATGLGKGYAFVTFKDEKHLSKSLAQLQNARFKGRSIRLTKMMKKKKNVSGSCLFFLFFRLASNDLKSTRCKASRAEHSTAA